MAEDYLQIPTDGAGKKIRAVKRTVGLVEVFEQCLAVLNAAGDVISPATEATLDEILKTADLEIDTDKILTIKDFPFRVSEQHFATKKTWTKIGFNGALVAATEADLWGKGGPYVFPTAAGKMEHVSSSAADKGTSIFSGTSTGGDTTSLTDAAKDFTAGVAVEVGDCVILDKAMDGGRTPEWGYVTGVAAQTLTIANGFSSGGSGSGRNYYVVDKNSAGNTGAQAVKVEYLDGTYTDGKTEISILDGTTPVDTVNTDLFRVNSYRVIAVGSGGKAAGNLTLRADGAGATYSYIEAGFTRARNIQYTVPAGKTLYVLYVSFGYAYASNSTHYARLYTRANIEPSTGFRTGDIFYPFSEGLMSNNTIPIEIPAPTRLPEKTDIRVSALADFAGVAVAALRGILCTN